MQVEVDLLKGELGLATSRAGKQSEYTERLSIALDSAKVRSCARQGELLLFLSEGLAAGASGIIGLCCPSPPDGGLWGHWVVLSLPSQRGPLG